MPAQTGEVTGVHAIACPHLRKEACWDRSSQSILSHPRISSVASWSTCNRQMVVANMRQSLAHVWE